MAHTSIIGMHETARQLSEASMHAKQQIKLMITLTRNLNNVRANVVLLRYCMTIQHMR